MCIRDRSYTPPNPPPGAGPNVGPTGMPYPFDPMGGVNPKDHIEGIEAGDVAKFVQANTPYYMGRFLNLSAFKRGRFHFAAFLFGGGWFLYRKPVSYTHLQPHRLFLQYLSQ